MLAMSVAVVACGGKAEAGPTTGAGSAANGQRAKALSAPVSLSLVETDSGFEPDAFTVERGQTATFNFTNAGKAVHNFRVASASGGFAAGSSVGAPLFDQPGQSSTLTWKAPDAAGTFLFRCDYHPDHTGTITVR